MGIEVKLSDAPQLTKSMHSAWEDLELDKLLIAYPGPLHKKVQAMPLRELFESL